MRWVVPIDVETGAVSDPELLGPVDFADRVVTTCRGDEPGWLLDIPWTQVVRVDTGAASSALRNNTMYARLRIAPDRACVERLSGTADIEPLKAPAKPSIIGAEVSVLSGQTRHLLRCTSR